MQKKKHEMLLRNNPENYTIHKNRDIREEKAN